MSKASIRDLPIIAARGASAATTVAATTHLAALAGVRVFATGGLGGVHRGATTTFDESADLTALAEHPVAVVTAGVKSVLDIGATLERLETLSVPVVGFGTGEFPSFWLRSSGFDLDWRVEDAAEVAAILHAQDDAPADGRPRAGLVVANPVPEAEAWDRAEHDRVLAQAFAAADAAKVRGKAVTPFLLSFIVTASEGVSLEVNSRGSPATTCGWPARSRSPTPPADMAGVLAVGDVIDDVIVRPIGPIAPQTRTPRARFERIAGGSAANTACWLASIGTPPPPWSPPSAGTTCTGMRRCCRRTASCRT